MTDTYQEAFAEADTYFHRLNTQFPEYFFRPWSVYKTKRFALLKLGPVLATRNHDETLGPFGDDMGGDRAMMDVQCCRFS